MSDRVSGSDLADKIARVTAFSVGAIDAMKRPGVVFVDKTLTAASTSTTVVLTVTVPSANAAGTLLVMRVSALSIQNASADVAAYSCDVRAGFTRKDASATNAYFATIQNETSSGSSGMSGAAAWSVSGTTGDQVATLTFTLTHLSPSVATSSVLRASVEATHRRSTAMTLA